VCGLRKGCIVREVQGIGHKIRDISISGTKGKKRARSGGQSEIAGRDEILTVDAGRGIRVLALFSCT